MTFGKVYYKRRHSAERRSADKRSENAAVAIIPAAILAEDKCILENVPSISDVDVALEILSSMGAQIRRLSKSKIEVDTSRIKDGTVPYELARSTRGSSYF